MTSNSKSHLEFTAVYGLNRCFQVTTAYAYVVAIAAGPAWYQVSENQTIYIQPNFPNTYVSNQSTQVLVDGELFAGIQRNVREDVLGQLGLTFAQTSPAKLDGLVWEMGDPAFDNLIYSYRIIHTHVAVKGKALITRFNDKNWPYVSGSAGVGFNRSYNYGTTEVIDEAVSPPDFNANTKTTFTYTLGIGLQHKIDEQIQVGVGYAFADWGKSALAPAPGQSTSGTLALNHLYTNQLQLNLTYLG